MGNRAVITTADNFFKGGVGVYIHWNGSPADVQKMLDICKEKGYRAPEDDPYGWAYLCREYGNFFDSGLSVGIDLVSKLDTNNGDNGTYFIEDWKIIDGMYNNEAKMNQFFKDQGRERKEVELCII